MIEPTINDAVTLGSAEALLAGRYRVVRQLGQGGMGSVYLAEDTQLDNFKVAIKMLPAILVANKRALKQLKAEALVSMKLNHSNIVPLRGFEENNGIPFLVMDYIEGQTLDDLLAERETLTEEETIRILSPVAVALDYAHGEGVVHRDVKPGNVMIRKDGRPFVLDFGIAREIQETMTRVTGKLSSGTLMYMSPEQNNGDEPTPAQDVYSFAAMAYECLAGKPPFTHGNIEYQIMNTPPAPLPGGTQLVASVMSGLAKKPEDRPPTCTAVLVGERLPQKEAEPQVESLAGLAALGAPNRTVEASSVQTRESLPPANNQVETVIVRKTVHKKVQLWEGGPYWADTNIGAEKPEDCGFYFWWGDIVGYKRERDAWVASDGASSEFKFDEDHTPTYGKGLFTLKNEGWIIGGEKRMSFWGQLFGSSGPREEGALTTEHDAAWEHWGGKWRMPTKQELDDLCNKCDWGWVTTNGVNGYFVRGRDNYASASIFLPCAGYGIGTLLYAAGSLGLYWSSVPSSGYDYTWRLSFNSGYHGTDDNGRNRFNGQPVRPVQGFTK